MPLTDVQLPNAISCPFATTVVTVIGIPSGSELTARAGQWSITARLPDDGNILATALTPGTQISIIGTLDASTGPTELAVTVDHVTT